MDKKIQESPKVNKLIKDANKRKLAFNKRTKTIIKKMVDIRE